MKKRKKFIIFPLIIGIPLAVLVFLFNDSFLYLAFSGTDTLNISRKDAFRTTARLMITATKVLLHQDNNKAPEVGKGTYFMLSELGLNNMIINAYEDDYDIHNSYVVVINDNNNLKYYVTLKGKYMNINLVPETKVVLSNNDHITKVSDINIDGFEMIK